MIDIHTHILPGLDDGAEDINESIEMAKAAAADGITGIIATPHHKNGRYNNSSAVVEQQVCRLNEALLLHEIDLHIRTAGQEIRMYHDLISDLEQGELLPLAGSPYILIEFSSRSCPVDAMDTFHELQVRGFIPVIAHPERNAELIKDMNLLYEFVQQGVLTQITSHSILGLFGKRIRSYALSLCKHNLTHLISTDAHDRAERGFNLGAAYRIIQKKQGRQACQYFMNNAQSVWNHQPIMIEPSIKPSILRKILRIT